ncbi:MAG: hypothetical protein M3T96_10385 [Acidobacteriota bacterium]|nr:hypothetical protein [Acidobacteriota bacterium]
MQNMNAKSALGLDANVAALLAYIPFCFIGLIMSIIILVTDKTNKLARFHAFQSIILHVIGIVLYLGIIFVYGIAVAANSSILVMLGSLAWVVVILGLLVAVVLCCVKAFQGQIFKLPIIGNLADNWSK